MTLEGQSVSKHVHHGVVIYLFIFSLTFCKLKQITIRVTGRASCVFLATARLWFAFITINVDEVILAVTDSGLEIAHVAIQT